MEGGGALTDSVGVRPQRGRWIAGRFHHVEVYPQPRLSKTKSAGLDASFRLVGHGNLSYAALYFGLMK